MKLSERLLRLVPAFEFWPFWLFYLPMFFYGVYLAWRARSLTYFTAANPGMRFGGAFGMSKSEALDLLEPAYRPRTVTLPAGSSLVEVLRALHLQELSFPIVGKPDVGERGAEVEKLADVEELSAWLSRQHHDLMLQEFVDFPVELGVLYYRTPDGREEGITSVVQKAFLSVVGDGHQTIDQLICRSRRARPRLEYLRDKFAGRLDEILPHGEVLELEPIGNHSRGTTFLDGNHLINPQLVAVFSQLAEPFGDYFYYGRFDLKVSSLADLYAGRNIRVLEVNGVNSEPAHIYQPGTRLRLAYRAVAQHMRLIYRISLANHQRGVAYGSFADLLLALRDHWWPVPQEADSVPAVPVPASAA